ncbi:MAG: FeoB-associated Cys-rich membrane protein [Clostridia bacterium]|nr:FeoB-associated Cys-rich membrane protein [Clostridia bacterium]
MVIAVVALLVAGSVVAIVRRRKKGCSCGCGGCAYSGTCAKKKTE